MGHFWNVPPTALQTNARPLTTCVSLRASAVVDAANAVTIRARPAIPHNTTSTDSDEAEPSPRFAGLWYRLRTMRTLRAAESRLRNFVGRSPKGAACGSAERDEPG